MSERVQIDLLVFVVVFLLGAVVAVTRAWWRAEHTYRENRRRPEDRRDSQASYWATNKDIRSGKDRRKESPPKGALP